MFCIGFIEIWRGVPLITVLFMANVMLPLFLPPGTTFDKLLRALVGVTLFSSAYMAEVVRGGLQAIPRGQYEAASALGLGYWRMMRLIILPQALKIVIPGIVNNFIGLFKDTTLVVIVGIFDLLGMVQVSLDRPELGVARHRRRPAIVFAAMVYWIFCFAMSRYSHVHGAPAEHRPQALGACHDDNQNVVSAARHPACRHARRPQRRRHRDASASTSGTATSTCCATST